MLTASLTGRRPAFHKPPVFGSSSSSRRIAPKSLDQVACHSAAESGLPLNARQAFEPLQQKQVPHGSRALGREVCGGSSNPYWEASQVWLMCRTGQARPLWNTPPPTKWPLRPNRRPGTHPPCPPNFSRCLHLESHRELGQSRRCREVHGDTRVRLHDGARGYFLTVHQQPVYTRPT